MMIRHFAALFLTLLVPLSAARAEVLVFAAASMKQPMDALAATADDVVVSYGGSGALARQVSLGAPADIVLLANVGWMDHLAEGGFVQPDGITDVASNRLVLVGSAAMDDVALTTAEIDRALAGGRIAVGMTGAVPAGIYAKQALTALGLWDAFSDRLAEVDNVRAALALVARGQAPLGIVYETDLRVTPGLRVLARFPEGSHMPIRYMLALTTEASGEAQEFVDLILSTQGQDTFAAAGFLPPLGRADD